MAQPRETGDPPVTANNPIADLLAAPLGVDWTIDRLAEDILRAIAALGPYEGQEFVLDAEATTDRQTGRLLRPLLACLATKSAAESGTPPNLYGGNLTFQRSGPDGLAWILGRFENRPGAARVALFRTSSPSEGSDPQFRANFMISTGRTSGNSWTH
jgi:hypothetical protein